jgi:hypothetical protein
MSRPPYRALQVLLYIFTLLLIVSGLLMIFGNKMLIMRVFLRPPEAEFSTLLLFVLKEMGGFVLMFSLMLFFAARDPVGNVAIIDAVIVGLGILTLTPLLSLYTLDVDSIYPSYLVWGRSLVRLALAALLYFLKPQRKYAGPLEGFEVGRFCIPMAAFRRFRR